MHLKFDETSALITSSQLDPIANINHLKKLSKSIGIQKPHQ